MKRSSGEAIDSLYGQLKALSADAKYGVPVYASLTEAIRGIISSSSMRGMSSLHSRTVNALQLIKIIPSMSADIPSAQASEKKNPKKHRLPLRVPDSVPAARL